jgi:hypothetical protein
MSTISHGAETLGSDLQFIQPPSLTDLAAPLTPNYRDLPIEQGFALETVVTEAARRRGDWPGKRYSLISFESYRRQPADVAARVALDREIAEADEHAYAEAARLPGFIVYSSNDPEVSNPDYDQHVGQPDTHGRALSWCLWDSWQSAGRALTLPAHQYAINQTGRFYERYRIRFFDVIWLGMRNPSEHREAAKREGSGDRTGNILVGELTHAQRNVA